MTNEFCRAATLDDLKKLMESLNKHKVEYMLIGGYALFAHGYSRSTIDIDVLVCGTVESGVRVRDALLVLPDGAAKDIDPIWFEEGENIRVADAFIVDVMLNANGQTYDSLKGYVDVIDVDGVPVRTVNLEGLLLTKQTVRDKDVADRAVLERALQEFRRRQGQSQNEVSPPTIGGSSLLGASSVHSDATGPIEKPKTLLRRLFRR